MVVIFDSLNFILFYIRNNESVMREREREREHNNIINILL